VPATACSYEAAKRYSFDAIDGVCFVIEDVESGQRFGLLTDLGHVFSGLHKELSPNPNDPQSLPNPPGQPIAVPVLFFPSSIGSKDSQASKRFLSE